MKIYVSMSEDEFNQVAAMIPSGCSDWANPLDEEYIFYNPTEQLRLWLTLKSISYYIPQDENL